MGKENEENKWVLEKEESEILRMERDERRVVKGDVRVRERSINEREK